MESQNSYIHTSLTQNKNNAVQACYTINNLLGKVRNKSSCVEVLTIVNATLTHKKK